eukprot:s152_g7.t1
MMILLLMVMVVILAADVGMMSMMVVLVLVLVVVVVDGYSVKDLARDELLHVSEDDSLADVLSKMQNGTMRMAVVYDKSVQSFGSATASLWISDESRPDAPALGVITMADVVQQLLLRCFACIQHAITPHCEKKDGTTRSSQRRPSVTRTRSLSDFVARTSRSH